MDGSTLNHLFAELITILVLWGTWIFAALLLVSIAGSWWLWRRPRRRGLARTGAVLLALLALGWLGALGLLLGPASKGVAEVRRMHSYRGRTVPELRFRRVSDDAPMALSELRGQIVVVNFWGTWCPPCRREMPDLDRLQETHRDRGLVVVTLSDEPREDLQAYLAEHPLQTLTAYSESVDWVFSGFSRPLTVLVDRDGRMRDYLVGARDYAFFERWVGEYLGG